MTAYAVSKTVSQLLSRFDHREVKVFGVLALLSFGVADYFYAMWFLPVWSFFAALLSVVSDLHFSFQQAKPGGPKQRYR